MTLTVRLDATLQAALDQHCAQRGVTKTLVVQECLARYLVAAQPDGAGPAGQPGGADEAASTSYRAFAAAGLIGAVAGGNAAADKATVRARALQRLSGGTRQTGDAS